MSVAQRELDFESEEFDRELPSDMESLWSDGVYPKEGDDSYTDVGVHTGNVSIRDWAIQSVTLPKPENRPPQTIGAYSEDIEVQYKNDIRPHPILKKADEARLAQSISKGTEAEARLLGHGLVRAFGHSGLSDEEVEAELAAIVRSVEDKREFVSSNLKLVVSVAKKYVYVSKLPLLELIQEGNLGLQHAVDKFEWRKGFKFSTYARWWIRQYISRAMITKSKTIDIPDKVGQDLLRLHRVDSIANPEWDEASIASLVGVSEKKLEQLRQYEDISTQSLDEVIGDDTDRELSDTVSDPTALQPFEDFEDEEASKQRIDVILEGLENDLQKQVLALHYGLDGGPQLTLTQIAERLGISGTMAQRVNEQATLRLRRRGFLQTLAHHCDLSADQEILLMSYFGEGRSPRLSKKFINDLDELCDVLMSRLRKAHINKVIKEVAEDDKPLQLGLLNRFRVEKQLTSYETMPRKLGLSKAKLIAAETEVLERLAEVFQQAA